MASQEPLSRSGLTTRADIPNDVMTFWVRRGLVRPIYAPSGMGRHLRFEWYEANIAAVMSQLRQFGVPIDGLLSIASTYREAIDWASRYELTRADVNALHNLSIVYAHYARHQDDERLAEDLETFSREKPHGASRITERIKEIHTAMPKEEFDKHVDPFKSITEQPKPGDPGLGCGHAGELTYLWQAGDLGEYRFAWGEEGPQLAAKDGARAMIAIDVASVLYEVWNRPEGEGE